MIKATYGVGMGDASERATSAPMIKTTSGNCAIILMMLRRIEEKEERKENGRKL
jgi:hypothetical protein